MKTLGFCVVGLAVSLSVFSAAARAEEGPGGTPQAVASGFVIQPRFQTQSSLLGSVLGDPGFLLGYRSDGLTIGLGGSFSRTAASQGQDELSLTILQIMPSVSYDVWRSADGRVRFDLLGAVGYGHASVSTTTADTSTTPATITTDDASISFVPIRVGVGADYFFHPNFGIGGEAGLQTKILTSADVQGQNQDISVSDNALFGAIHLTFIVGQ